MWYLYEGNFGESIFDLVTLEILELFLSLLGTSLGNVLGLSAGVIEG